MQQLTRKIINTFLESTIFNATDVATQAKVLHSKKIIMYFQCNRMVSLGKLQKMHTFNNTGCFIIIILK